MQNEIQALNFQHKQMIHSHQGCWGRERQPGSSQIKWTHATRNITKLEVAYYYLLLLVMCSTAAAIMTVLSKVAQVLKQSRLQHLLCAGTTAAGRSPELTVRSRRDRSISTWHRLAAKKHQVTKWEVGKSLQRKKKVDRQRRHSS